MIRQKQLGRLEVGAAETAVLCCLAFVIAVTLGCRASFPTQPTTPAPLALVAVRYPTSFGTELFVGALPNFEAYSVDADGVYTTITSKATWTSSNAAVMLSSAGSGFFFIAGPGSADVNATYQGVVGSLTVTARSVPPYPYLKISLPGLLPGVLSARLVLGPTQNVLSQDISALVVWSSSNTNVATVQDGRVSPVAPGNAEIRASYNGLTDSCFFSVPPRGSESIVR